jgi:hypothetical protein
MVDAVASRCDAAAADPCSGRHHRALKAHIFNDVIWPDFSRIPTPEAPFISFHEIHTGQTLQINRKLLEVLPAVHTVPAVGYAITAGTGCWVFSGDTERNPAFWERVNQFNVAMLVIETAFSNREKDLAKLSLHLSPGGAGGGTGLHRQDAEPFPIYITHTKPAETDLIMAEIQKFDQTSVSGPNVTHDIRWLRAGQEFDLVNAVLKPNQPVTNRSRPSSRTRSCRRRNAGVTFEALFYKQLHNVTARIHDTENLEQIMLEASQDICKLLNADRLTCMPSTKTAPRSSPRSRPA